MVNPDPARLRRETLNIRITPEEKGLIDRAARAKGKNRTDFILEAARSAAQEALVDQLILTVGTEAYEVFVARLDAPPRVNEGLLKTMRTLPPWDKA
jgi:uncharacterized protein (DUF1778 family)